MAIQHSLFNALEDIGILIAGLGVIIILAVVIVGGWSVYKQVRHD